MVIPEIPDLHMSWEETDDYVKSIRALQKKYADQIRIYLGFEAEYLPQFFEQQKVLVEKYQMDYVILGQHFLPGKDLNRYSGKKTKDERRLKLYADTVIKGLSTGFFRYLCHPDLIRYEGKRDIYDKHMRRLCEEAKRLSCPLEINLLGLGDGRHYPNETFWAIAGEVGNDAVIGIDAHDPAQIGKSEVWEAGVSLAQKYHLRIVENIF